jgi:hypothetical protein
LRKELFLGTHYEKEKIHSRPNHSKIGNPFSKTHNSTNLSSDKFIVVSNQKNRREGKQKKMLSFAKIGLTLEHRLFTVQATV